MGTIYGTDYISKLPIFPGENVVVILLRKQEYERNPFPCCCYIGDMYAQLGIPIYGKYEEGLRITDIENSDDVIEYLKNIVFKTDENVNKTVTTTKKLEELLIDINMDNIYGEYEGNKFGPLGSIIIKRNLYDRLLHYMKNRLNYYTKETLENELKSKFFEELSTVGKEIELEDKDEIKREIFKELYIIDKLKDISCVHNNEIEFHWEILPYLKRKLYDNPSDTKSYAQLEEIMFFRFVLEALHSGYYCIINGVDETEMLIHRELAKYILEETSRIAEIERQESIYDDDSDEGVLSSGSFYPNLY